MDRHPHYQPCDDLPELLPSNADGPELALPEIAPETIVFAVSARQAQGGTLTEKIDGVWATGTIGPDGRITQLFSRANLALRFDVRWDGVLVDRRFAGWSVVGELEVGTTRAAQLREARGESIDDGLDPWHVYALISPDGVRHEGSELGHLLGQLVPLALRGRMFPVREALPGEDWGSFTREVFERGGEGVVIRQGGKLYRAKPQIDFDRAVRDVVAERDSTGRTRLYAMLAVCTSAGSRPRYHETQKVLVPSWAKRPRELKGLVVTIIGSSVNLDTGVVRFARITRVRTDKTQPECKLSAPAEASLPLDLSHRLPIVDRLLHYSEEPLCELIHDASMAHAPAISRGVSIPACQYGARAIEWVSEGERT